MTKQELTEKYKAQLADQMLESEHAFRASLKIIETTARELSEPCLPADLKEAFVWSIEQQTGYMVASFKFLCESEEDLDIQEEAEAEAPEKEDAPKEGLGFEMVPGERPDCLAFKILGKEEKKAEPKEEPESPYTLSPADAYTLLRDGGTVTDVDGDSHEMTKDDHAIWVVSESGVTSKLHTLSEWLNKYGKMTFRDSTKPSDAVKYDCPAALNKIRAGYKLSDGRNHHSKMDHMVHVTNEDGPDYILVAEAWLERFAGMRFQIVEEKS